MFVAELQLFGVIAWWRNKLLIIAKLVVEVQLFVVITTNQALFNGCFGKL